MKIIDSLIIGAGPAGLSAAIYLKRFNRDVLILSSSRGGQMFESGIVENFASYSYTTGPELTSNMLAHISSLDIEILRETVLSITKEYDNFISYFAIKCDGNTFYAKTVLICSGAYYKRLNIEGENNMLNRGVSFCITCDGSFFADKNVTIIGGGNSALDGALTMSRIASKVNIINKNSFFKGDALLYEKVSSVENIKIWKNCYTSKILGVDYVTGVQFTNNGVSQQIDTDGVFVKIGMNPLSAMVENISPSILNDFDEIIIDNNNSTSLLGMFAAGDVTDTPYKQISVACGEGAKAAISINNFLN